MNEWARATKSCHSVKTKQVRWPLFGLAPVSRYSLVTQVFTSNTVGHFRKGLTSPGVTRISVWWPLVLVGSLRVLHTKGSSMQMSCPLTRRYFLRAGGKPTVWAEGCSRSWVGSRTSPCWTRNWPVHCSGLNCCISQTYLRKRESASALDSFSSLIIILIFFLICNYCWW